MAEADRYLPSGMQKMAVALVSGIEQRRQRVRIGEDNRTNVDIAPHFIAAQQLGDRRGDFLLRSGQPQTQDAGGLLETTHVAIEAEHVHLAAVSGCVPANSGETGETVVEGARPDRDGRVTFRDEGVVVTDDRFHRPMSS